MAGQFVNSKAFDLYYTVRGLTLAQAVGAITSDELHDLIGLQIGFDALPPHLREGLV